LTMEHDNLRAALAWCLAESQQAEMALRLVAALTGFWVVTGHSREGRRWAEAALALTTAADHTEMRAKLLLGSAFLAIWQGDAASAQPWIEEGMALARELGAQMLLYDGLVYLGWLAHGQNDYRLAVSRHEEALALAREAGDKSLIAQTLIYVAGVVYDEHDYEHAQALYEESLALFEEAGDDWHIADTLQYMGQLAQAQGHDARATALFRDSLTRWRRLGLLQWKGVVHCLDGLAGLCVGQRQFEEAARLFGAAEGLRDLLRGSPSPLPHSLAEDKYAGLRAELGEAAFATAWAAGRVLSTEEAIDYALALPAVFVSTTSPEESAPLLPGPVTYPAGLTQREVEVLRLLPTGLTYAQIADTLIISRRTVNAHLTSIYSKLGVNSRAAATRFAVEHRLA
jgi:non-specific serine/threonine protein kinase